MVLIEYVDHVQLSEGADLPRHGTPTLDAVDPNEIEDGVPLIVLLVRHLWWYEVLSCTGTGSRLNVKISLCHLLQSILEYLHCSLCKTLDAGW